MTKRHHCLKGVPLVRGGCGGFVAGEWGHCYKSGGPGGCLAMEGISNRFVTGEWGHCGRQSGGPFGYLAMKGRSDRFVAG